MADKYLYKLKAKEARSGEKYAMITGPRVKEVGTFIRRPNRYMLMNMAYDDGRSSIMGANYDYYLGSREISKNDDLYNTTPPFHIPSGLEDICKKHFSPEEVENVFETSILDVLAKRQKPERFPLVIYYYPKYEVMRLRPPVKWVEFFNPHRIIPDYHPLGDSPQHKYKFGNNVEKFWHEIGICSFKTEPASVTHSAEATGGAGGGASAAPPLVAAGGSGVASAAPAAAAPVAAAVSPLVAAGGAGSGGAPTGLPSNKILPHEFGDNKIVGGSRGTKKKQKRSKKRKTNKK